MGAVDVVDTRPGMMVTLQYGDRVLFEHYQVRNDGRESVEKSDTILVARRVKHSVDAMKLK